MEDIAKYTLDPRTVGIMDHDIHVLAADTLVSYKRLKDLERQIMRLEGTLGRHMDDEARTWELERELDDLESRVRSERWHIALLEAAHQLLLDRADGATVVNVYGQALAMCAARAADTASESGNGPDPSHQELAE